MTFIVPRRSTTRGPHSLSGTRGVMQCSSYSDLIYDIFEYLKDVLRLETHNTFNFKKELYAQEDGFGAAEIVASTLKKISPTASIYEALNSIWDDIQVSFDYAIGFTNKYETFDASGIKPMIRAFFQEEYADPAGAYISIFKNRTNMADDGKRRNGVDRRC